MSDDQEIPLDQTQPNSDPFERWTSRRPYILLISWFVAFLSSITTAIYLPVLPVVARDLETTEEMVNLTVAVTFILLGVCPMIWGSVSDQFGRRKPLLFGILVHCVTSIACGFAWNIESLLVFRVLQALGAASLLVIGAGSIADIYPPDIRGNALGWFTMAPSVGPLIGPPIGGLLAQAFGWRSIFFAMAVVAGLLTIVGFFAFPETLLYLNEQEQQETLSLLTPNKQPTKYDSSKSSSDEEKPSKVKTFSLFSIVAPFRFLIVPKILAGVMANAWCQSTSVGVLTFFPYILDQRFGLDAAQTGLSYLPYGVGALIGSKVGGWTCDWFAHQFGFGARLFPAAYGTVLYGLGVVLWIYASEYAIILTSTGIMGFAYCGLRPGVYSFLMEEYPRDASAIASVILCVQYSMGCIATITGPMIWKTELGKLLFFWVQAGCIFLTVIPLVYMGAKNLRKSE